MTFEDFWNFDRSRAFEPHHRPRHPRPWIGIGAAGAVLVALLLLMPMAMIGGQSTGAAAASAPVLTTETAPSLLSSATPTAQISSSSCGVEPIFVDSLRNPPWYPASWSGTTVTSNGGRYDVTLPNDWSAFSLAANEAESVTGCTHVQFQISSPNDNPTLKLSLNNSAGQHTGMFAINDSDFVDNGRIDSTLKTVSVPLSRFELSDGLVTRFTLANTGTPGVQFTIDNIGFVRDSDIEEGACHVIYGDSLDPAWAKASWTVADDVYADEISLRFPRRWGALSLLVSDQPMSSGSYQSVAFTMHSSVADSDFDLRLNTAGNEKAGDYRFTSELSRLR